jgi:hypothetical protein
MQESRKSPARSVSEGSSGQNEKTEAPNIKQMTNPKCELRIYYFWFV